MKADNACRSVGRSVILGERWEAVAAVGLMASVRTGTEGHCRRWRH